MTTALINDDVTAALSSPYMQRALELAAAAAKAGEVPVGAVLVRDEEILGEAFNSPISLNDPSAHAEILALRQASQRVANYRLPNTTLYVTLEPCSMCCGAIVHARVSKLIFAAREPRAGSVVSARNLLDETGLNHRVSWIEDQAAAGKSAELLQSFFRDRR
ncbi:MAG: tRNA adenosine(34) deaminase TadA [Pseudomonadota bacterium]